MDNELDKTIPTKDSPNPEPLQLPSELFTGIDEFVPLKLLAEKFKIDEAVLAEEIAKGSLPATLLGNTYLVNKSTFAKFLKIYSPAYKLEECLDKKIKEIDEKACMLKQKLESLSKLEKESENWLEMPHVLKGTGLYEWMTRELAVLIPHKRKREIFFHVSSGKKIRQIAETYGISDTTVRNDYNDAIKILEHKFGFLKDYREIMSGCYHQVRALEIALQLYQKEIAKLLEMLSLKSLGWIPDLSKSPAEIINLLSSPLERLGLKGMSFYGLKNSGIYNLKDLVLHIHVYGFESLLGFQRTGNHALKLLKKRLREIGITNENDEIILFIKQE